jgi:predicted GNAT family N-acyltransferase
MAIRAYLDQHDFDPETVRLMGVAFECTVATLRLTVDDTEPARAAIARKIIELAQRGERDPERLSESALDHLRETTANVPPAASTSENGPIDAGER